MRRTLKASGILFSPEIETGKRNGHAQLSQNEENYVKLKWTPGAKMEGWDVGTKERGTSRDVLSYPPGQTALETITIWNGPSEFRVWDQQARS